MQNTFKFKGELENFYLSPNFQKLLHNFRDRGFVLEVIPRNGNFSEYINYVLENKNDLEPEFQYIKNNLEKGDSWGEILLANKSKLN